VLRVVRKKVLREELTVKYLWSDKVPSSSTGLGFGVEPLGGALANTLMILPEVLRFIVVVDFSGSLFPVNQRV
jgi:hypothetical protein